MSRTASAIVGGALVVLGLVFGLGTGTASTSPMVGMMGQATGGHPMSGPMMEACHEMMEQMPMRDDMTQGH
jgi:hypothetical protein